MLPTSFATYLYFGQNQQEMSASFPVVKFECSACYCRVMLRSLSEWCGMVMFIESHVADEESVMNIDKQLENVYGVTTVSCWTSQISGSEKG
jgi:hypothetical protein